MELQTYAAFGSLVIAILAFTLSSRAAARAKEAARGQLFLELRTKFWQVHEGLTQGYSTADSEPSEEKKEAAIRRYWHHCFDEWYLTNRSSRGHMKILWEEYFAEGVAASTRDDGLWQVLESMSDGLETPGREKPWKEFREELSRLRARH